MTGRTLWRHARLATLDGDAPWGWIERGALVVGGDTLKWVGAEADLPPEFDGRADEYADAVCAWLPELNAQGLVDAVDGFCDRIGFTAAQTRRVFEAARRLGLPVKLHAEQLSDQGGAALAAEFGALSADHLEHVDEAGALALARPGTVGVPLPGAY